MIELVRSEKLYVFDAKDKEVAYGQATYAAKKTNLFEVEAITGRHASLDIASVCLSGVSYRGCGVLTTGVDKEVAYGQATYAAKKTNLFEVEAITGRHASLDIASVCLSGVSYRGCGVLTTGVDKEVAYGQATYAAKKTNLFEVEAITGRHASLDIASVCFSGVSYRGCGVLTTGVDKEVAYGQATYAAKKTNLFEVEAITGRHASLDIASVCFSVFSVVSLAVLKAGEVNITVTWSFNKTLSAGTDSAYKTVKVKLCYAPISQKDRGWPKTEDELKKNRTCQHKIVTKPYNASTNSFTWTIARDIPSATYFVRAYVFDAKDKEVAYGQATDAAKKTNLFEVEAMASLDIASMCFSVFSVVSLADFFYLEKGKARVPQQKRGNG
ncbi:hypothetical protein AgCh_011391 [Apium graveolens]